MLTKEATPHVITIAIAMSWPRTLSLVKFAGPGPARGALVCLRGHGLGCKRSFQRGLLQF